MLVGMEDTISTPIERDARSASRRSLATRFYAWLLRCVERHKQRQRLRALDAHLLDDIGLSRHAAQLEAEKPFWRS
jgi:uncharacterized protein YjiS (DUF1127 family)